MLKPSEPVQWLDGDSHRVGRVLRDDGAFLVSGTIGVADEVHHRDAILVQWSHTGELEFVEWGKLSPYPSSPIPDPSPLALLDAAYDYGGPG